MFDRSDFHNYQHAAVRFIDRHLRCALFVQMGLGKTVSMLTGFLDLVLAFRAGPMIVFGPKRVTGKTWPDEFKNWLHLHNLTYAVVDGPEKRRLKRLSESVDVHLISCDLTEWFVDAIEQGVVQMKWDVCVIDESSKYKNRDSTRWKSMRRLAFKFRRFHILTGTPSPNGLHDLWAQLYLVDGGARLGRTLKDFRDRWFTPAWDGSGYNARSFALEQIQDKIKDIVFTLRAEDYLDLPPITYVPQPVVLPEKIKAAYDKFEREYVLEIDEAEQLQAASVVGLTTKLLQLANGVVYDADKNGRYFHHEKIKVLGDIIDEAQGNPVLVAYNFKSDLAAIKQAFPQAVALGKDNSVIDQWNAGEVPLLCIHPKSAGHGLNLQHGGSIVVWYSLTWSLEEYQQLNARLHRQGQKNPVVVHHLIAGGTVDEKVLSTLRNKNATQNKLLDALKQHVVGLIKNLG